MAGTITHEWVGTTLVITSDSGSSGCDLKGDRGDIGIRGPQGPQGEKPEVFFTIGIEDDEVLDTEWKELNVNGTRVVESINLHTADMENPHNTTPEQIGAEVAGAAEAVRGELLTHIDDNNNPHGITKAQVGLGNVDNTADKDKPVSTAQSLAINAVKIIADTNTDAISAINNSSTGILAQAKQYTNEQMGSLSGGGAVSSVNGKSGAVVLTSADIDGLDASIEARMPKTGGTFTGAVVLGTSSTTSNCASTSAILRNVGLSTSATNPSANGCIVWQYA